MPSSRNIKDCTPKLQAAWAWAAEEYPRRYPSGPKLILLETHRPAEVQRAYYAQGREKLAIVNKLRNAAGLAAISENENRRIITYKKPGGSKHEATPAKAFDIGFVDVQEGKTVWVPLNYKRVAMIIAERFGDVTWGGDWDGDGRSDDERFVDAPHFEV